MPTYKAPGRLGDPNMTLETEPRVLPEVLGSLRALGVQEPLDSVPVTRESPLEDCVAFKRVVETRLEGMLSTIDFSTPVPGDVHASVKVARRDEVLTGRDGNLIRVIIQRPAEATGPLPGVVYIHGGGMVYLHTDIPMVLSWATSLARSGMVVVTIDFRNVLGDDTKDLRTFPCGLHDCVDATRWVHANRDRLGISALVLQGESGGANLSIATALTANQEGWIHEIDGVFGNVPYLSNAHHLPEEWKLEHLPSLVECDGYFLNNKDNQITAMLYDPTGENDRNPLAWPWWATEAQLVGLPRHCIVTNELDPLRDEGIDYARRLARAGVPVVGKVKLGVTHLADLAFRYSVPGMFVDLLYEVKAFADSIADGKKSQ